MLWLSAAPVMNDGIPDLKGAPRGILAIDPYDDGDESQDLDDECTILPREEVAYSDSAASTSGSEASNSGAELFDDLLMAGVVREAARLRCRRQLARTHLKRVIRSVVVEAPNSDDDAFAPARPPMGLFPSASAQIADELARAPRSWNTLLSPGGNLVSWRELVVPGHSAPSEGRPVLTKADPVTDGHGGNDDVRPALPGQAPTTPARCGTLPMIAVPVTSEHEGHHARQTTDGPKPSGRPNCDDECREEVARPADEKCPTGPAVRSLLSLAALTLEACSRGLGKAKGNRAKNMVHRGVFAFQGQHTLKRHFFADNTGALPVQSFEERLLAPDTSASTNLRAMPVPYNHSGDAKDLDAALGSIMAGAWANLEAASPTLARVQGKTVCGAARGLSGMAPFTAASAYIATAARGTADRGDHDATRDSIPARSLSVARIPLSWEQVTTKTQANGWHVDWHDAVFAHISHIGYDVASLGPRNLCGGVFLLLLGRLAEPRPASLSPALDADGGGKAVRIALAELATTYGGWASYPVCRAEVKRALSDRTAVLLSVRPGAELLVDAASLWHCVLELHHIDDAGGARIACISYGHGNVIEACRLLGSPATNDEMIQHPAVLRFGTSFAALAWRLKRARVLPERLVPKRDSAHNWAKLVLLHPPLLPPTGQATLLKSAPRYALCDGLRVDIDGLRDWLAREDVARSVFGTLCGSQKLRETHPAEATELGRMHDAWWKLHGGVFFPPLRSTEEPRCALLLTTLRHLTAESSGRWSNANAVTIDARAILCLVVSTQVNFDGLHQLLCGPLIRLIEVDFSAPVQTESLRTAELTEYVKTCGHRQRLQPLSKTRRDTGGRIPLHTALGGPANLEAAQRVSALLRDSQMTQRAALFSELCRMTYIGAVLATVMVREARCLPWSPLGLIRPGGVAKGGAVRFGCAPTRRLAAFVHPADLSKFVFLGATKAGCITAIAAEKARRGHAAASREVWVGACEQKEELRVFEAYVEMALLKSDPELDEYENMLCEVGKGVIGRSRAESASCDGQSPPPLRGFHVPLGRGSPAAEYGYGGGNGPLVVHAQAGNVRIQPFKNDTGPSVPV